MLLDKIAARRRSTTAKQQVQIGLVTPLQFYGIDINPFAVELAKVTLTIAKKVAIDKLDLTEKELPLDTLDQNIICEDAFQVWSGEAKVHVSIVNWNYEQPSKYFLDDKQVNFINSSLQPHIDVSGAKTLQANNQL